ncbi:carboxypeptidase regulatory-like domain-containing protein, partial [Microbacterium bovistercoris]|uniref:carboxypeptidase regulatory-like domain-containing protein n=1 Tax=Microbacterium bovistercoris TaxID=2293570 RepID=UPI0015F282C0
MVSPANGGQVSTTAQEKPNAESVAPQTGAPIPPESSYGDVVTVLLSGRILKPGGAPATGVQLTAFATYGDDGDGNLGSVTTDAEGTFSFPVSTARTFILEVLPGSGFVPSRLGAGTTLVPGQGWDEGIRRFDPVAGSAMLGDLTLIPGQMISGDVTVSGTLSPTDTEVSVWSDTASFTAPVTIATGSTAWSVTVPSGTYRAGLTDYGIGIFAYHGGTSSETAAPIVVTSASVSDVGIDVSISGRTLSGTVLNSNGEPVEGASVSLGSDSWSPGDTTGRNTTTAADGSYTLINLVPGSYRLSFWAGGPTVYWPGTTDYDAFEPIVIASGTTAVTGKDVTVVEGVRIAGTVTNSDGTPREGDQVRFVKDGQEIGSTETKADGTYSSWALPAGEYLVSLVQGGYGGTLEQWYDGKRTAATADPVAATDDGATYDGIDFVAVTGGTISGTITFADGTEVADASVLVYAAHDLNQPVKTTTTDAAGHYTLSGLTVENYVVKVQSGASGAVDAWYGATEASPEPKPISLGLDETFIADVVTRLGGTIRGTVILAAADQGAWVSLSRTDGSDYRSLYLPPNDGNPVEWEMPGLLGSWIVSVDEQYWQNATQWSDATPIDVQAGQVVSGIDFDLRAVVSLTGTVTTTDGSEVSQINATVEREVDGFWQWVASDSSASAQFAFALDPGQYRLRVSGFTADGDALRDTTTPFSIAAGETTNLTVPTARGWTITGRITDAETGAAVPGTSVRAESDSASIAYTSSSIDGTYRLVVAARGSWTVSAGVNSQKYTETHREVVVDDAALESVDLALSAGHQISGRVTAENNGNGLSGVQVSVLDAASGTEFHTSASYDGSYATPALTPGEYTVRFSNWSGLYVEEWWEGAPTPASAATVSIDDADVTDIDASMRLGGVITGRVTDADGNPVPWATVGMASPPASGVEAFFGALGRFFTGAAVTSPLLGVETSADANGNYSLPPVEAGSYALYVHDWMSGTTWYDGKSTLATADLIQVDAGNATDVPLRLRTLTDGETPRTPEESITDDFAIQVPPQDTAVQDGEYAEFRAVASGIPAPTVQWERRAPGADVFTPIDGEMSSNLSFEAELADSGAQVRAVFTQGDATLTTVAATVTVSATPSAPQAPSAPEVSDVTSSSAMVSWSEPESGGAAITGYVVRLTAGQDLIRELAVGNVTQTTVAGLSASTAHAVTVSAVNAVGTGDESASTSFTTGAAITSPTAPTSVTATAGNAQATVSWTAPSSTGGSPITGYTVTAQPGGKTATTTGATSATVTGLTNGTAYTFTVTATNAAGISGASAASDPVTPVAPVTPPTAPTSVTATAGNAQATVSWTAPSSTGGSPITGYTVTAQPGGKTATTTGATSATVTGLTNGTAYTFTVTATNAAGTSAASAASAAVTPTAPPTTPPVTRQAGANRYDTAVEVSKATYPSSDVPVVYIA